MKKKNLLLYFILLIVMISGCSKEFIEVDPPVEIDKPIELPVQKDTETEDKENISKEKDETKDNILNDLDEDMNEDYEMSDDEMIEWGMDIEYELGVRVINFMKLMEQESRIGEEKWVEEILVQVQTIDWLADDLIVYKKDFTDMEENDQLLIESMNELKLFSKKFIEAEATEDVNMIEGAMIHFGDGIIY